MALQGSIRASTQVLNFDVDPDPDLLLTLPLMRIRIQHFMHNDADSDPPQNWKHPYYALRK
jgi:hypothetical protein